MKKRIFSALAALSLFICSCTGFDTDKAEPPYENIGPSSSAPSEDKTNVNYSSYEFTILTKYATDGKNIGIFEGERNSQAQNAEIAKRNTELEKSFNIKLKEHSSISPTADIDNALLLSDKSFDMIYAPALEISLLLSGGKLVDLADFSAFELDKDYYESAATAGLSVAGKTFALAGTLTASTTYATSAMLVNNALMNKTDVKNELGMTVFNLVENGGWTLDKMNELSLMADTKGLTEDDLPLFSGFSSSGKSALSLMAGLGASIFENKKDAIPSLSVKGEGFAALFDAISHLAWSYGKTEAGSLIGSCYNLDVKQGEALFTISTVGKAKELSDSGLCFSLVPMPKADPAQPDYISRVELDMCELAAIPSTTSDLARSAAVLSSLFSLSKDTKSAYLSSLKTECPHDNEKMLEIIERTKHYDLGDLFGWGDFDAALESVLTNDEPVTLEEVLTPRALAAEKALDIVLKRLLGENYKENQ